ncbi:hypothetical protein PFICI_06320 [Pestalotiopsis fici W106-1]|uniref:N-acetyltransferase domain-containing protein n=1 Tax=Pestalotiopsis fici (strain W106-1 / CGMCC3.15140) TaxID=1229662 RepID=W3X5D1_PESFW|nr:uncharacterized protein PFICI_06320 [Pestalotiopsis fici W106-1]ETS81318.1 hypothetical protein PFICI_06320 [Pestalotiopsis fici W106-1]
MQEICRFVVSPVDFDRDWDDLFSTYWDSWKDPLQATGQLTFPRIGTGGKAEAAAFTATKIAYLAAARADVNQHWVKLEDGRRKSRGLSGIVGGGAWTLHRTNSFGADHCPSREATATQEDVKLPGPGFEPGSERHGLMQQLYQQMWSWHPRMMNKAHIYGQALWVLPEYRKLGAAAVLMDYWVKMMNDSGLEAYLEGSHMSTPLYQKYGFILVNYIELHFTRDNPSDDWHRLVKELQSEPVSIMWRPSGGKYVEGKTIPPCTDQPRAIKL